MNSLHDPQHTACVDFTCLTDLIAMEDRIACLHRGGGRDGLALAGLVGALFDFRNTPAGESVTMGHYQGIGRAHV